MSLCVCVCVCVCVSVSSYNSTDNSEKEQEMAAHSCCLFVTCVRLVSGYEHEQNMAAVSVWPTVR